MPSAASFCTVEPLVCCISAARFVSPLTLSVSSGVRSAFTSTCISAGFNGRSGTFASSCACGSKNSEWSQYVSSVKRGSEWRSCDCRVRLVSPVYRKLASLIDKGHLVSIDKSTRLPPLEVPVKPKWFGLETLRQIGTVRREVSYRISLLRQDELKSLENRRKKMGELLDVFTFSLADGQRWMPSSAEELFRHENERVNGEAKGILAKLIAGDLTQFMAGRRTAVAEDANFAMTVGLRSNTGIYGKVAPEIRETAKFLRKRLKELSPEICGISRDDSSPANQSEEV